MLYICSKITTLVIPRSYTRELKLDDNDLFTYGAYYKLLLWGWSQPHPQQTCKLVQSLSDRECDKELSCYIWQMIAGPICYYLNNPLLAYWFPQSDDFYTTASNFIRNNKPRLPTNHQTAFIPWVKSVVIKHYVLGKEVLFCRQDKYIDLYRQLPWWLPCSVPDTQLTLHHWQWFRPMPRTLHLLG
jgi:hypothetical protein